MTKHEQHRRQKWRLKVLEEATVRGNVAKTCRHYGISREIFYQWRRRYQIDGLAGLRDRSHAPHHCPRDTAPEIVEKVLYLRQHYPARLKWSKFEEEALLLGKTDPCPCCGGKGHVLKPDLSPEELRALEENEIRKAAYYAEEHKRYAPRARRKVRIIRS